MSFSKCFIDINNLLWYLYISIQVDVCFLVDCTGSMSAHIEAVKKSITDLHTSLVLEYKECRLLFSFVRYTDYDQPEYSRTTVLDFTRYVYNVSASMAQSRWPTLFGLLFSNCGFS